MRIQHLKMEDARFSPHASIYLSNSTLEALGLNKVIHNYTTEVAYVNNYWRLRTISLAVSVQSARLGLYLSTVSEASMAKPFSASDSST
jgi:uncharacterized membrane protein